MTTPNTDLAERIRDAFLDPKPWRAAVEAVMRFEGYSEGEIEEAYGPVVHTEECTDNGYPFGYDCTDERGRDQHPFHTRSCELDGVYRAFFEESDLAAAVLPLVEAAVKRGQAEALRDAADSVHDNASSPYCLPCHRDDAGLLHTIASEYEKGTPDEQ